MISFRKAILPLAALVLPLALAGCGQDGPQVVRVHGTLTYKGQPVANAEMQFLPENGRQSWAETDAQGRFKVNYDRHQDGAVVGKHKVSVQYRPPAAPETEPGMPGKVPPLTKELKEFFDKYGPGKTPIEVEITPSSTDIKLDVK